MRGSVKGGPARGLTKGKPLRLPGKGVPIPSELLAVPVKTVANPVGKPPLAPRWISSPYDHVGELPEAYGTGRLFCTARDPYWLYTYWDFTRAQRDEMRQAARWGQLKLRVHAGATAEAPLQQEIALNPDARNWFIHVGVADADYCAEFGYDDPDGRFVARTRSRPAHTPPDQMSARSEARFVTIPWRISFRELLDLVRGYFRDGEELADVLHRLQEADFCFPFDYEGAGEWSAEQERALSQMFEPDLLRRVFMGSQELTEWLRRRSTQEAGGASFSPSSPFGASFGAVTPRGFWFNVNAELIIYGATDPKATVTFDGKPVALRPDGTFRFQFALPDGDFRLPITATSPDQVETREALLRFARESRQRGGVGVVSSPAERMVPGAIAPQ